MAPGTKHQTLSFSDTWDKVIPTSLMSRQVVHPLPLQPVAMPGSSSHPSYNDAELCCAQSAAATSIIMSSQSQTTSSPSSDVNSPHAPPIVIFELNQARRAKATRNLEALRSGTFVPSVLKSDLTRNALYLPHSSPIELPTAFLEWPTVEGLEAFVVKKTEYKEMMGNHIRDLQAVTREQLLIAQGLERSAKVAEECRFNSSNVP